MNPDLVLQNHQKEMMIIESLSTSKFYFSQLKNKNFNHNLFGILQNCRMWIHVWNKRFSCSLKLLTHFSIVIIAIKAVYQAFSLT